MIIYNVCGVYIGLVRKSLSIVYGKSYQEVIEKGLSTISIKIK